MKSFISSALISIGLSTAVVSASWGHVGNSLFGTYFGIPNLNATYDYVVVGGGLAGLVVASRLAEDPSLSIAVIEPGSFYEITNGNQSQIPFYSTKYVSKDPEDTQPLIDWELVTVPQPQLGGQTIHYAQGKCLGGSSGRNQLIYHRGTAGSYDRWAAEVGDEAFAWKNILPYFQKSVNFTSDTSMRAPNTTNIKEEVGAFSSTGGPLHVSYPKFGNPASTYAEVAFKRAGFPVADGFSGGVLNGSTWNPFTVNPDDGTRSSSETSFLQSTLRNGSANLKLYIQTQAMNIIFNETKTAMGVNVSSGDLSWVLSAKKEVIVSAGAFHSPQLLMVSGIGPAETLRKHNISVVSNLPGVGQGMWDTTPIGGVTYPVSTISDSTVSSDPALLAAATEQFLANGSGILTNSGGDHIGWEKLPAAYRANLSPSTLSDLAKFPADWPEIEHVVNSGGATLTESDTGVKNYATIGSSLIAAISRGNMTIASASMKDKPVISTNWLLEKTDQELAVQAYRRTREIWSHMPPGFITGPEVKPGANYTTDAQLLEYIRTKGIGAVHHASSTNKMGLANDTMAVVDSHGKVFGVKNLRVIDSSSFRFTPPGHTQGATFAHAEKLVDDIKKGL